MKEKHELGAVTSWVAWWWGRCIKSCNFYFSFCLVPCHLQRLMSMICGTRDHSSAGQVTYCEVAFMNNTNFSTFALEINALTADTMQISNKLRNKYKSWHKFMCFCNTTSLYISRFTMKVPEFVLELGVETAYRSHTKGQWMCYSRQNFFTKSNDWRRLVMTPEWRVETEATNITFKTPNPSLEVLRQVPRNPEEQTSIDKWCT